MSSVNYELGTNLIQHLAMIDMRQTDSPGVKVYPKGSLDRGMDFYWKNGYTFKDWSYAQEVMFDKKDLQNFFVENLGESVNIENTSQDIIVEKIWEVTRIALTKKTEPLINTASKLFKVIDGRETELPGVIVYKKSILRSLGAKIGFNQTYTFETWPLARGILFERASLQKFLSENLYDESIDLSHLTEKEVRKKISQIAKECADQPSASERDEMFDDFFTATEELLKTEEVADLIETVEKINVSKLLFSIAAKKLTQWKKSIRELA